MIGGGLRGLASGALLATACAAGGGVGPVDDYVPLVVLVQDHRGRPVAGAGIAVDGSRVGITGDDGRLDGVLAGPDGRRATVEVACPDGLVPSGDSRRETAVRRLKPIAGSQGDLSPVVVRFGCAPALREHLLVVRTDGRAGLPVRVGGQAAIETGPSGAAHAVIREPPGEEIEIVIDTESREELRPRSPSRRVRLPEDSRIVLFDQRFEERKAKAAVRKRGAPLPRRL